MWKVNINGDLFFETTHFVKACHLIKGVKATELWCDAYHRNKECDKNVLLLAEFVPQLNVVEHSFNKETFVKKGGGFRFDHYIK